MTRLGALPTLHSARRAGVVCAVLAAVCGLGGFSDAFRAHAADHPRPSYPARALAFGIDAEVVVLIRADREGRAAQVKLEEISAPGWGFAESVRETVSRWRFTPARIDGEPVPRVYRRTLRFEADRPRDLARMYPLPSSGAFEATRELMEGLGLPVRTLLEDEQVIISEEIPVGKLPGGFPSLEGVGSARWRFVQLHLFVPPGAEPARVYCNARLARYAGDYVSAALYSEGTVESWLLDALDERLGQPGHAVPLNPERLERRASKLAADAGIRAGGTAPRVLTPEDRRYAALDPASPIDETRVPAIDPTEPRPRPEESAVKIEAVVHEDGSVAVASVLSAPRDESDQLRAAAVQAARLWRFRPATLDGRPVPATTTLTLTFPDR